MDSCGKKIGRRCECRVIAMKQRRIKNMTGWEKFQVMLSGEKREFMMERQGAAIHHLLHSKSREVSYEDQKVGHRNFCANEREIEAYC